MASNGMNTFTNPSLSQMARRLGVSCPKPPVQTEDGKIISFEDDGLKPKVVVHNPKDEVHDSVETSLEGIYHQSQLLNNMGGHAQQERMIYDKKRSLDKALLYSYQGADIKKVDAPDDEKPCRALINPNKLKQDYDDKVVSCNWDYGLAPGSIFQWMGTNTYWIIYLQDLTELAYFRGDIRKCSHTIKWMDVDTNEIHTTYAAVRGPVETKISSSTKNGDNLDSPNYSLSILIPESESALKYFRRYAKFYMQGYSDGAPTVCWKANAVNWISMPGVIELVAQEDYINKDVDDVGEIPEYKEIIERIEKEEQLKTEEESKSVVIVGDNFIKPKITYTYTCSVPGTWTIVGKNCPILILQKTHNEIKIKWDKFYSGQFILKCGDVEKTIVVETLY